MTTDANVAVIVPCLEQTGMNTVKKSASFALVSTLALTGIFAATMPAAIADDDVYEEAAGAVTASDIPMVETTLDPAYTESSAVLQTEGDRQQAEAVENSAEGDQEQTTDYIARADLVSTIAIIGVTWNPDGPQPAKVSLRTLENGLWSEWSELELAQEQDSDAPPTGTEPFIAANSSAVEVVANTEDGNPIDSITVTVVDPEGNQEIANSLENLPPSEDTETTEDDEIAEPEVVDETTPEEDVDKSEDETTTEDFEGLTDPDEDSLPEPSQEGADSNTDQLDDLDGAVEGDPAWLAATAAPSALTTALNPAGTQFDTGKNGLVINTRKAWNPNPAYLSGNPVPITIQGAVIHHTAGGNNYSKADVPGILRGIYYYHAVTLDWGDIGYNLLVDKFGGVWEGRTGGLTKAIKGAQAYGANSQTFGISVLGDFSNAAPPAVAQDAVAKAVAWKLGVHGITTATGQIKVDGYDFKGRMVPRVSGHRDIGGTACPGQAFYNQLPALRTKIANYMKPSTPTPTPSPSATPGWNAGNIISDAVFYNAGAMTEAQIKTFIEKEGASCKSGSGKNCLKDKKFPSANLKTLRGACKPLNLSGNQAPWTIIAKTASACGLNPQVILSTIQKESSAITQPLTDDQWTRAMGSGCPTGQSCDSAQAGFMKQVYYGADKLASYKLTPDSWPYLKAVKNGASVSIPYNPDKSCGAQTVKISNYATASLYTYTPYVPNKAALDAYPGTASCGSYGNRNFYMNMKKWFNGGTAPGNNGTSPGGTSPTKPQPPAPTVTWKDRKQIGWGWSSSKPIFAGNIDRDNYPDLMIIDSQGNLGSFKGQSGERFGSRQPVGWGWKGWDWVQGGIDWDGDGKMDLVARNKSTGGLYLYSGNGNGNFKASRQIGQGWNVATQMALVRTSRGPAIYAVIGGELFSYPGNGKGGFNSRVSMGKGWGNTTMIVGVGDWTGDSIPDVVMRRGDGTLHLYPGTSNGLLGTSKVIGQGWNVMSYVGSANQYSPKQPLWAID
ncbi:hypothetical protein FYJ24_11810, partial [Actinomycetaceae bacterium WB03_NA08]